MAQLEAGPSGEVPEGDLEWPCPKHPANARFVLQGSQERQLWDIFGGQGHVMVLELTKLTAQLESTQKWALFAWQLVEGDMQLAAEVSFWCLSFTLWIRCWLFLACLPSVGNKEDVVP